MKRTFLVFLILLFAAGAYAECATIILVRHAEQTDQNAADPPLSDAGAARATALASALKNSRLNAIYVTQYKRTKETAAPVATLLHLTPVELTVEKGKVPEHASELAKRLIAENRGRMALVVGHSNTVPAIVEALTNIKIKPIDHDEFDRFVVVSAGSAECNRVVESQYGH